MRILLPEIGANPNARSISLVIPHQVFALVVPLIAIGCVVVDRPVIINYIPFQVLTYSPVTVDSIEAEAHCRFVIDRRSPELIRLRNVVSRTTRGDFDEKAVRLKASGLFPEALFVDRTGGLLFRQERLLGHRERVSRLTGEAFDELRTILAALAESQDCG
jgi:hypothetical protein